MGFFSWKTQDTDKSIANQYSDKSTFPVTMTDNKGNKWHEDNYEGYGVFGGKDYYELLAEMNGKTTREEGISLEFGISAIRHKESGQIYKSSGIDFFNWQEEILPHGLCANASVSSGEWESITIRDENVLFPNLTEDKNWEWKNEQAENCEHQGFFYPPSDEELETCANCGNEFIYAEGEDNCCCHECYNEYNGYDDDEDE